jgi:hypothetical protein
METAIFVDKSVKPNDEIIFSIIGDTKLICKQTFLYLFDNSKDISVNWKYSNCGKYWVCQALKKKKSLFRIRISKKNSFTIAFPIGDQLEPIILQSNLPDSIKNGFIHSQRFNKTRYISIDVKDSKDFENVKKLIDLKINN